MKSISKAHAVVALYILSAFLFAFYLVLIFPQESRLLSPYTTMRLPFLAGILAFIGARFPSVGIGSVFVIMMIEPVMGTDVYHMTADQHLWLFYYETIIFILLGGGFVSSLARVVAKGDAAKKMGDRLLEHRGARAPYLDG